MTHKVGTRLKRWSAVDMAFLEATYRSKPYVEIAKHLGRTADAVRLKVSKMRLRKRQHGHNGHVQN